MTDTSGASDLPPGWTIGPDGAPIPPGAMPNYGANIPFRSGLVSPIGSTGQGGNLWNYRAPTAGNPSMGYPSVGTTLNSTPQQSTDQSLVGQMLNYINPVSPAEAAELPSTRKPPAASGLDNNDFWAFRGHGWSPDLGNIAMHPPVPAPLQSGVNSVFNPNAKQQAAQAAGQRAVQNVNPYAQAVGGGDVSQPLGRPIPLPTFQVRPRPLATRPSDGSMVGQPNWSDFARGEQIMGGPTYGMGQGASAGALANARAQAPAGAVNPYTQISLMGGRPISALNLSGQNQPAAPSGPGYYEPTTGNARNPMWVDPPVAAAPPAPRHVNLGYGTPAPVKPRAQPVQTGWKGFPQFQKGGQTGPGTKPTWWNPTFGTGPAAGYGGN